VLPPLFHFPASFSIAVLVKPVLWVASSGSRPVFDVCLFLSHHSFRRTGIFFAGDVTSLNLFLPRFGPSTWGVSFFVSTLVWFFSASRVRTLCFFFSGSFGFLLWFRDIPLCLVDPGAPAASARHRVFLSRLLSTLQLSCFFGLDRAVM